MVDGEVHTEFWWGNLRERDQLGDTGVARRIILEWILIKCGYIIFCPEMCLKMKIRTNMERIRGKRLKKYSQNNLTNF